jgi:hypothetical protein
LANVIEAAGQHAQILHPVPPQLVPVARSLEIEDDVDLDDDEPIDIPVPVQPPAATKFGGAKPQQAEHMNSPPLHKSHGKKRGFSLVRTTALVRTSTGEQESEN